jgi:hypothetical protein
MRSRLTAALFMTVLAALCGASTARGLERTAARSPDLDDDAWSRTTTSCTLTYYNICTGWLWIWGSLSPGERFGVLFDTCCAQGTGSHAINGARLYCWTGCPSGYGFTGTMEIWSADIDGCPTGSVLHTQAHLPTTGWNEFDWTANPVDVPGDGAVALFDIGGTPNNPVSLLSDHPAPGPTGPAACGTCFPTTRLNHSFAYGTVSSPLCPGLPLNDGICDSQLLLSLSLSCVTTVAPSSWGEIKQLYR